VTNTLAYFVSASLMKKNSFITMAIVIKLFSWSHTVVQFMNKASIEAKSLTHKY
jgi:hypothetical protein